MGRLFAKLLFSLMALVLVGMAYAAFRAPSEAGDPWAERNESNLDVTVASGSSPDLRTVAPRTAPQEPASPSTGPSNPADHSLHSKSVPTPKRQTIDTRTPLPVNGAGQAILDWDHLAATRLRTGQPPEFPASIADLDGKPVRLSGFMAPLDDSGSLRSFLLLEFPVGCFFCQVPGSTSIAVVELSGNTPESISYDSVTAIGTLQLNHENPEEFLFTIRNARLSRPD